MRNIGKIFFLRREGRLNREKTLREEGNNWKQRKKEGKEKEERSNLFSAINCIVYSNLRSSSKVKVFILIYDNALRGMANI